MLAALTLTLAWVSPPRLEVAYIARYYYPPPSKKTSKYHIYLTDLHGKRRVQVSRAASKVAEFIGWIDQNRVAWRTTDGKWDTYNVKTGRREFLKHEPKELDVSTHPILSDDSGKAVTPGGPDIIVDTSSPNITTLIRGQVRIRFKVREDESFEYLDLYPTGKPNSTYLVSEDSSANGMYEEWHLYVLDWQAGKCSLRRRYFKGLMMYVDRDLALCEQKDRNLIPYGNTRTVWGGELYAFQLSTNKIWKIVGGLVNAHSPRLRPRGH